MNNKLYQVDTTDFWDFTDRCRAYYLENSPLMQIIDDLKREIIAQKEINERLEYSGRAFEVLQREHAEELEVELQFFWQAEKIYFRILEKQDVFSTELVQKNNWPIEKITDESTMQWADQQIKDKHYAIVSLLTITDASLALFDYQDEETDEQ